VSTHALSTPNSLTGQNNKFNKTLILFAKRHFSQQQHQKIPVVFLLPTGHSVRSTDNTTNTAAFFAPILHRAAKTSGPRVGSATIQQSTQQSFFKPAERLV
jgi:hypothetical protein